jgi:hypothetical protein
MKRHRIRSPFRFTVFLATIILLSVFFIGSFFGYFDAASMDDTKYIDYKVKPGDTLWDIAKQYGSQKTDCRQTIYEICSINDITAGTMYAGITILIPVEN